MLDRGHHRAPQQRLVDQQIFVVVVVQVTVQVGDVESEIELLLFAARFAIQTLHRHLTRVQRILLQAAGRALITAVRALSRDACRFGRFDLEYSPQLPLHQRVAAIEQLRQALRCRYGIDHLTGEGEVWKKISIEINLKCHHCLPGLRCCWRAKSRWWSRH